MKIERTQAEAVYQQLSGALEKGYHYTNFQVDKETNYLKTDSLDFFHYKSGAKDVAYLQKLSDGVQPETLPTALLKGHLGKQMEFQQIASAGQPHKDLIVLTWFLHGLENRRTEIYADELKRQLKGMHLKVDQQQLKLHLFQDDQKFELPATLHHRGKTSPYTVHIEQNLHRAFLISDIQPRENIHQPTKSDRMYSDVLEGTVKKEDAQEIKKMLQEEKAKGNRFVSFPGDSEGIKKEDFKGFKSALDAQEHAFENTSGREKHLVRSIPVVEKEVDKVLENKNEQEKPSDKDRQQRRSKDELLR